MIRWISLMTGAVLVMAACGGSSDPAVAPAVSDSPPSNDASASPELPELSVDDLPPASLGAFAVDLHGARITPQILAGYGDPNVHQIAARDANAWVTVGDSANTGAAYVARYGLDGVEVGRVNDDGRPLGIETDPLGRGALFGDAFNEELHFYETSSDSIATTIGNVVSSLRPIVLNSDGSIWSIASGDRLARVDPESGAAEKTQLADQNTPTDALLIGDTFWQSDVLADAVTSFNCHTEATATFAIPFATALLELCDGSILVSGEQLHTIDAATGDATDLRSVVYPTGASSFLQNSTRSFKPTRASLPSAPTTGVSFDSISMR
jgi:hypothetical protein